MSRSGSRRRCQVRDCEQPHHARDYCARHYYQHLRQRDLGACSAPDCSRVAAYVSLGQRFCSTHSSRFHRGADLVGPIRGTPEYEDCFVPGARWAHQRVAQQFGRAAEHTCIECGNKALDWAYDGTDPTEHLEDSWRYYSVWPEFYMPMCRKCHTKRDAARAAIELREYRELKRATGMSASQMRERIILSTESTERERN